MSKLEELIQKYCPDGVEKVELGTLGVFENIGVDKTTKEGEKLVTLLNYVDVYHHKHIYATTPKMIVSAPDKKIMSCSVEKGDIFITPSSETRDDIGHSSVVEETIPNAVYSYHIMRFRLSIVNMTTAYYINYVFDSEDVKKQIFRYAQGLTRFGLSKDKFGSISIPLPPLPVQEEIVRILDAMTDLQENLEKELEERRKQYAFYRDKLLSFNELTTPPSWRIEWKQLGEICKKICSGGTPTRNIPQYFEGNIPWMRTQEVDWKDVYETEIKITEEAVKNSSAKIIPINCVIIAMYGATAGKACINKIPLTTNQACCNLVINQQIANYKYVYYWIGKNYEKLKGLGEGSQNNINAQKVKSFPIPLPPLSVQQEIVAKLDKMEELVSNIENELTERKKQYTYYREQLLAFEQCA